jgi:hypothetical protein
MTSQLIAVSTEHTKERENGQSQKRNLEAVERDVRRSRTPGAIGLSIRHQPVATAASRQERQPERQT